MRYFALPLFIFTAVILCGKPAGALESPWKSADHLQARLISGVDTAGADTTISGLLEVKLEDGWHSYWRMAGDGGLAPTFDWKGSANVDSVTIDWQTPARFETAGLQSFGYAAPFALPLTVKLKTPGQPVGLSVKADIMTCKDICVPQTVVLTLAIPPGNGAASPDKVLVDKARANVPGKGDNAALKIDSAVVGPDALVVQAYSAHGFDGAELFAEPAELVLYGAPKITPDAKDPRHATLLIAKGDPGTDLAKAVMGKTLVLTLITKDGAIEKSYPF